jgi:hypothetical protein
VGVIDRVRSALAPQRAADTSITVSDWAGMFGYLGSQYGYPLTQTLVGGSVQQVDGNFPSYVAQAYKGNGIVFACMNARMRLFSEARFQFRQLRQGRPGDLFGTQALGPLETPWPGGTTGDLLARAIQDADIAGNFYAARRPGPAIRRLRPDWVTLVLGSENDASIDGYDIDAELVGLVYHPGGMGQGREPEVLLRGEFAHFAPIPDPLAAYRGMSWITPIVREVMGDTAATDHKLRFFENGATPNMVVSLDKEIQLQAFNDWVSKFREREPKGFDAYKTLYLGAGAKAEVVGANLQQLDFKVTQGAGETRIAAAAGVPPIIVGLSEGLQAATYSNYGQARRAFADGTMRPAVAQLRGLDAADHRHAARCRALVRRPGHPVPRRGPARPATSSRSTPRRSRRWSMPGSADRGWGVRQDVCREPRRDPGDLQPRQGPAAWRQGARSDRRPRGGHGGRAVRGAAARHDLQPRPPARAGGWPVRLVLPLPGPQGGVRERAPEDEPEP